MQLFSHPITRRTQNTSNDKVVEITKLYHIPNLDRKGKKICTGFSTVFLKKIPTIYKRYQNFTQLKDL